MISVAIIAKNRQSILPQCIGSARKLSEDVVVVTNADHQFKNFADQKNYVLSLCKHDWVLSLDTDEELTEELIEEIKQVVKNTNYVAFKIPRINIIFGKKINYTNWDPQSDSHVWLFRKSKCRWVGEVHEEIEVEGEVGSLENCKMHHAYKDVEQFIEKMNHYTSLADKTRNPVYEFLRRFVWHRGFLDSWHGLFLSYLMGVYYLVVTVKQWERN